MTIVFISGKELDEFFKHPNTPNTFIWTSGKPLPYYYGETTCHILSCISFAFVFVTEYVKQS